MLHNSIHFQLVPLYLRWTIRESERETARMNQDSEVMNAFEISHEKASIRKVGDTQFIVIIKMFSFYFKNHLIVSN